MSTPIEDVATLLTLFERSPEEFAWRYPVCNQIEARRAQMNDQLIFDVILSTGGIGRPYELYPPTDVESLEVLLDAIRNSTYDTLKKDCLIYYLVKWHKDGREEVYRDEKCIPPQFVLLADAYWHLDTGIDVAKAVSILSDVRLNRDYPSKVLQAISLSDNANPLILKFVRTAKPPLLEPIDIDTYTVALAESSLLEAWQYQRTFPEGNEMRPRLVHKILEWCLSPQPRPEPLAQFLAFPFSDYEQTLVHKYALQPPASLPPSSIPVIQDLVCVRLVQSGQYASAIKLDRRFAASIIPGTTAKMQKAIQERRKMMDELLAALPSVERNLIEADLEAEASGARTNGTSFFGKGKGRANGPVTSWEGVVPSATVSGSTGPAKVGPRFGTSPIPTISERNDMPLFGGSVSRPSTANGSIFVPLSTSTSAPLQTQTQQSPFSSRATHVFPLSSSQSSRTPAPLLGSSGIKYPKPLFSQSVRAPNAPSLFSLAGSANQTRNAFYTPPVTNGVKRSFEEDEPRPVVDVPPAPARVPDEPPALIVNDDVNMDPDNDFMATSREADVSHVNRITEAVPTELTYSVFGNSAEPKQPPVKSRRITRADSEVKMPPGAYFPDDHEIPTAETTTKKQRNPSSSPPPPVKRTRSSRAQKLAHEPNLRRSLPGAFMAEEDNEEEDDVAPLPVPSKRPARKTRSTKSGEPEGGEARPTRRSTRLSTASSVASASPEPPSPQTTTGKIRKSKRSAGSKSASRKK